MCCGYSVDAELFAVKYNELFIPAALEIFDRLQIFFQFISNGGLGCTLAVFFVGFPNIPDNEIEVIKNHVAEIFIIADMGGLQHFQMGVVFARAIPFNDFMPDGIDKGVEVLNLHGGNPIHINLNIRDIREAHKKDSESAPQTTVADELKENLEAVENFKGSRDEKLVVLYCKQLGINYKNLSDEEFRWLIRILKKSKKMGTPISQRKKR